MMPLTRVQLVDLIATNGSVIFNGVVYTDGADLPTQEEMDVLYGGGATVSVDLSPISAKLPAVLDDDGGFKVHVQNPGGGEGGGGLTDDELRATPVPVTVSNVPAVQPVNDNGGSLTVDGTVAVSNFPATQPVSVSNFPATQPVSAAALPLPAGAATSANQETGNTSLASIDGKLPAALSGGALKVDLVGNTAGVGGLAKPAPVVLWNGSFTGSTELTSANISGGSYRGVRVVFNKNGTEGSTHVVRIYEQMPDGATFRQIAASASLATATAGGIILELSPQATAAAGAAGSNITPTVVVGSVPAVFQVRIFYGSAVSTPINVTYQLIP